MIGSAATGVSEAVAVPVADAVPADADAVGAVGVPASPVTRTGCTLAPLAMDAVTAAMPSGLTSTLPCPIMDAACSVAPDAVAGTRLVAAVTAIDGGVVSPSADAAEARSAWVTVSAWLITAVLHEWANAVVHGIVPSALLGYPSSLLNV